MVSGGKRGVNTAAPPPVTTLTEEEELMKESGESAIKKSHLLLTTRPLALYSCSLCSRENSASGKKDGRGVPDGSLHHH